MQKWQNELKKNITTIEDLKQFIKIKEDEEEKLKKVIKIHPMSIPRYYLSLIDPEDPEDPIRKMSVPSAEELILSGSYDTSGEKQNTKMEGLQHKYRETVLLLATNVCAMYCRYCFRKRLVGLPSREILRRIDEAAEYIKEHKEVNNVLVSGGDPFTLPTPILEKLIKKLISIPHLDFIRIGTRVPVTFPQRVIEDKKLHKILKKYSKRDKRIYIVTQFNHPKEITEESTEAIDILLNSGTIINNQTVLLKGVNDDPEIMANLQNSLVSIGVNPYYVFQCRPVKRVKHQFQVPIYYGYRIVEEAKSRMNGHSKRFKYVMSHKTGKIEIVGMDEKYIYFKYHQAKDVKNCGKFFRRKLNKTGGWLDDFEKVGR